MPKSKDIYSLLSNRTIRATISLLAEKGPLRATQIIESIGCSPGTFYDALKKMQNVVKKKEDGSYALTEEGMALYNIIKDHEKLEKPSTDSLSKVTISLPYIFPVPFFNKLYSFPRNLLFAIFSFLLVTNAFIYTYSKSFLILYIPIIITSYLSFYLYFASFLASLLLTFSLSYFISLLLRVKLDFLKFLFCLPITFTPSSIYSIILSILFNKLDLSFELWTSILPLFFSASFLVSLIYSQSKAKIEVCYIVAFIVLIASLIILQALLINLV